jgi:uncharacterized protein with von Willebrand factor type A (vWA) domain
MPNVIDSRELLEELRDLLDDPRYDYNDEPDTDVLAELSEDDQERVEALREVLNDLPEETTDNSRSSWGCTLIHEDYFEEHARELAEELGAIDPDASWPLNCIDWEYAAEQLKHDYTIVEFDGDTFYVR